MSDFQMEIALFLISPTEVVNSKSTKKEKKVKKNSLERAKSVKGAQRFRPADERSSAFSLREKSFCGQAAKADLRDG